MHEEQQDERNYSIIEAAAHIGYQDMGLEQPTAEESDRADRRQGDCQSYAADGIPPGTTGCCGEASAGRACTFRGRNPGSPAEPPAGIDRTESGQSAFESAAAADCTN